jgi:hypothetical protein
VSNLLQPTKASLLRGLLFALQCGGSNCTRHKSERQARWHVGRVRTRAHGCRVCASLVHECRQAYRDARSLFGSACCAVRRLWLCLLDAKSDLA